MVWPAILAAAAAGGAMKGLGEQQAGYKAGERTLDSLRKQWGNLELPELNEYGLERFNNFFTPQEVGKTNLSDIQLDPTNLDAQRAALAQLGDISQGGLTLQDKVNLLDIQNEVARQDAARQGAIQQNMAERGMGGGGAELAQRLMAQQAGSDRAANDSRNVAAMAQQRALDAIMQRGQLGGQMRMQEYGIASDAAAAQDAINRFNAGQRQEGQRVAQDLEMANKGLSHQEAAQANDIAQQQFQNQFNKLRGQEGITKASANTSIEKGIDLGKGIGSITDTFTKTMGSW